MSTLLHLIDDTHPAAVATLASLALRFDDVPQRVVARGPRHLATELADIGLPVTRDVAPPPPGTPVIAWSSRSAAWAQWRWRCPLRWVAWRPPTWWEALALRRGGATPLCLTDEVAAALGAMRMSPRRVEPVFEPRLLDGADGERPGDARPDDRIVMVLADEPREADVLAAVTAAAIATVAEPGGPRLRLLAHPDARHAARSRPLADTSRMPHLLMVDPAMSRPWRLLRQCDAVLLSGEQTALARRWARAAGRPVIDAAASGDARAVAAALLSPPNRTHDDPGNAGDAGFDDVGWRAILAGDLTPCAY